MESSVTVNDINHQKQQESVAAEIEQQNRQTKQHSWAEHQGLESTKIPTP